MTAKARCVRGGAAGLRAADRASLWASKRGKGDGRMSQRHSARLGSGLAGVARGTPAKEAPPSRGLVTSAVCHEGETSP